MSEITEEVQGIKTSTKGRGKARTSIVIGILMTLLSLFAGLALFFIIEMVGLVLAISAFKTKYKETAKIGLILCVIAMVINLGMGLFSEFGSIAYEML